VGVQGLRMRARFSYDREHDSSLSEVSRPTDVATCFSVPGGHCSCREADNSIWLCIRSLEGQDLGGNRKNKLTRQKWSWLSHLIPTAARLPRDRRFAYSFQRPTQNT